MQGQDDAGTQSSPRNNISPVHLHPRVGADGQVMSASACKHDGRHGEAVSDEIWLEGHVASERRGEVRVGGVSMRMSEGNN